MVVWMRFEDIWHFFFGCQNCDRCTCSGSEVSFRSHVAWAKRRNINLKEIATARCLKGTTISALIIKADVEILFSNSDIAIRIRKEFAAGDAHTTEFWVGLAVEISLFLAVFSLLANYTAYSIFNSLDAVNAPIVLRSTIGRYASQMPSTLVNWTLKSGFVVALMSATEISKPGPFGKTIVAIWTLVFIHMLYAHYALERTLVTSGAIGNDPMLTTEEEEEMNPHELTDHLLKLVKLGRKAKMPLNYQYAVPYQEILKKIDRGEIDLPLDEETLNDFRDRKYYATWRRN